VAHPEFRPAETQLVLLLEFLVGFVVIQVAWGLAQSSWMQQIAQLSFGSTVGTRIATLQTPGSS
jgi:hypothetical protein